MDPRREVLAKIRSELGEDGWQQLLADVQRARSQQRRDDLIDAFGTPGGGGTGFIGWFLGIAVAALVLSSL